MTKYLLSPFAPLTLKQQYSEIMKEKFNLIVGSLHKSNDGVLCGESVLCGWIQLSRVPYYPFILDGERKASHCDAGPLGRFQSFLEGVQSSPGKMKKE